MEANTISCRALAHSLQLARLMTRARGQAGIVFPADA